MSLFGAQPNSTPNKFGTLFGSTTAPPGGLFGQQQQQQQQQQPQPSQPNSSLFSSTAAPAGTTSLFGGGQTQQAGSSLFGASQQQQSQQQPQNASIFGGLLQPAPRIPDPQLSQSQQFQKDKPFPQLRNSTAAPFPVNDSRGPSVVERMTTLRNKWESHHPQSVFQYYFYNQVAPGSDVYYAPNDYEDKNKWEEALAQKPNSTAVPVLARGFEEIGARIIIQNHAVAALQKRLHEINDSLSLMKDMHELNIASRITEAKRKHIVYTQRCIALATKIQILRNRGYAMDTAEEELKKKLLELEKKTFDPVLGGRQEEIWARMAGVRERARIIQEETERLGRTIDSKQDGELLSEEEQKQLEKLLKDYDKQLEHLKSMVDETKKEYEEWQGKQASAGAPRAR